jgi:hypothetical protein
LVSLFRKARKHYEQRIYPSLGARQDPSWLIFWIEIEALSSHMQTRRWQRKITPLSNL